jgi:hypothetical protein
VGVIQHVWPWYEQPSLGVRAAAPGLVLAWRPWLSVYDALTGRFVGQHEDNATLSGTAPQQVATPVGMGVYLFHDIFIPNENVDIANGDSFTVIAWIDPREIASERYYVGRGRDGLGSGWSVRVGTTATTGTAFLNIIHTGGGTAGKLVTGTSNITGGAWVAGVYRQGVGTEIWVNGRLEASNAFTNITLRGSTRGWHIGAPFGSDTTSGNRPFGVIGDIAVFNRGLRPSELAENGGAPWWLFEPRQIWVPYTAAPSGAPTLSDLKATNITATSVQFTYDYSF